MIARLEEIFERFCLTDSREEMTRARRARRRFILMRTSAALARDSRRTCTNLTSPVGKRALCWRKRLEKRVR